MTLRPWTIRRILDLALSLATVVSVGFFIGIAIPVAYTLLGAPGVSRARSESGVTEVNEWTSVARHIRGSAKARVIMVEFSDFECPFCAKHDRDVLPRILSQYVDKDLVAYDPRHFPIGRHRFARNAGVAAECSGADFWDMRHILFTNQRTLDRSNLIQYAKEVGIVGAEFDSCLSRNDQSIIDADVAEGTRLGVNATPTFFIGLRENDTILLKSRISGAVDYLTFANAIDAILSEDH